MNTLLCKKAQQALLGHIAKLGGKAAFSYSDADGTLYSYGAASDPYPTRMQLNRDGYIMIWTSFNDGTVWMAEGMLNPVIDNTWLSASRLGEVGNTVLLPIILDMLLKPAGPQVV